MGAIALTVEWLRRLSLDIHQPEGQVAWRI